MLSKQILNLKLLIFSTLILSCKVGNLFKMRLIFRALNYIEKTIKYKSLYQPL